MSRIFYFAEGETERKVIDNIKNEYIVSGKCVKFNIWEQEFSRIARKYAGSKLIFIIDTDANSELTDRFNMNLKELENLGINLFLFFKIKIWKTN